MINEKFEITDIAHKTYPFLHRIRALRDVGTEVKQGDLGGFVEHEGNLSFEPGDDAWVFDNAIIAGDGYADKGTRLKGQAVVCGNAYVSHGSMLYGDAKAEDDAYLQGVTMLGSARASGHSVLLASPDNPGRAPMLSGRCCVYGKVVGDVRVLGDTVILSSEEVCSDSLDAIMLNGQLRTVLREPTRDMLHPRQPEGAEKKMSQKRKETVR